MDSTVSQSGKRRIQFIDLAKGVCIILVVLFHAGVLTPSTPMLSCLRMPLYFFLSGLFFKTYGGTINFMVKKINKIIVPFVFFYVVSKIICALRLVLAHDYNWTAVQSFLLNFDLVHNIPLWFLVCLFVTNLIFCVLRRTIKNEMAFSLAIVVCALAGVAYGEDGVSGFAYSATALTALPFFYFGYMSNRTPWLYPNKLDKYNWLIGLALIAVAAMISYYSGNAHISMRDNRFVGSALASYITSVLIVSGVLMICKAIKHLPWVSYVGRYSIVVLCTHMIIMPLVLLVLNNYEVQGLPRVWISGVTTLLVCSALIPLCIKYIPLFTAQKDILGEHTVAYLNKQRFAVHPRAMLQGLLHKRASR
jgi:fucose 4-O-acetylase-like acetyltransferase